MRETTDERKDRINAARRESAEISQQVGIDVTSLLVRPVARKAYHDFEAALKAGRQADPQVLPRCDDKEEKYVDYPDDAIPTEGKAKMMCAECPFSKERGGQCGTYAELEKPAWGVYDGHVYGRDNVDL